MHNAESTEGYRVYRELHGHHRDVSHRRVAVNMNQYIQKNRGRLI